MDPRGIHATFSRTCCNSCFFIPSIYIRYQISALHNSHNRWPWSDFFSRCSFNMAFTTDGFRYPFETSRESFRKVL